MSDRNVTYLAKYKEKSVAYVSSTLIFDYYNIIEIVYPSKSQL